MVYFYYSFIFILGLCVGSFLNVVVSRWPRGRSVVSRRSACERCRHILEWQDLIPLLSWFWLKGRCRFCRSFIGWQDPFVELTAGLLFLVSAYLYGGFPPPAFSSLAPLFYSWYITAVFIIIFMIDLKTGLVLSTVVFPAITITALYRILVGTTKILSAYFSLRNDSSGLGPYLLRTDFLSNRIGGEIFSFVLSAGGAVVLAFIFWLIVKITRGRGMGEGDIWLGFLVGLSVGFPNIIVAVFMSFTLGAAVSLGLIAAGRKRFGETVPFGPFLSTAALLTHFFGDKLFSWYLKLL